MTAALARAAGLQHARWECAGLPAGAAGTPAGLARAAAEWVPAAVPGTIASALGAAGRLADRRALDELDWWLRCRFAGPGGPHRLSFGGLATLADVWLNGEHLLSSTNMHRSIAVDVPDVRGACELVVRCAALAPHLEQRRPRPRWKTYLVDHPQLRWVRTSLLGRIPGWAEVPPAVGVWRPVALVPLDGSTAAGVVLGARCAELGEGGEVQARFLLPGGVPEPDGRAAGTGSSARLEVAGASAPLELRETAGGLECTGTVVVPRLERWWPHTHGRQPLYEVTAEVRGRVLRLGRVGFRTVRAERSDGGFTLYVNDRRIFCRGAVWFPPDPVSLSADEAAESHLLELAKQAGFNMLRVPGTTVYESARFYDRCDELGILVWQDCMFAFMDYPEDGAFAEEAGAEVREALGALGGRPSAAVVCGNQEVEEVAAMLGLEPDRRGTPLFDKTIAAIAADVLPGVPYLPSNPSGGDLPFRMGAGVSQYFGVGGYLRPPEDARRAGVRFAAECLAFATPPEPSTVEERCGGAARAGHDPEWKRGVHHDAGRSWDMEDVRDHYVQALFGADPRRERYLDAERALELGRAANAFLMESVLTEWRRPHSSCAGGLVLGLSDLRPGAGWGLVDSAGRPKAPWYALRRVLAPVALLAVDEGLNGLALHVVNDRPDPVRGELVVELVARGAPAVARAEAAVAVGPHGSWSIGAEEVLGTWRDVTYAYRFAPPAHDAVVATLRGDDDSVLAQVVHLPLGQARPLEADLGLAAAATRDPSGRWILEVRTERLAQWVAIRVEGFVPADSWFHLPPGGRRLVELWPDPGAEQHPSAPRGWVQALNCTRAAPVREGAR
jgi:beta-mannosidase